MLDHVVDIISLQQLEYKMERVDLPDDYNCFEIVDYGHPTFPYAHIQLEKATKIILSHFQEEYHPFIYDTLKNKKTQLVCLYFVYRPKKNASRTDPTDDDQKDNAFEPTHGDGSTAFHRHMISVIVFSSSNKRQIILVDYTVTEMGCFGYYSDAAPHAKTMRGNGITTFILYVAQCITFNQTQFVTATLIAEARLNSLY